MLTDRERYLVKVAVAAALSRVHQAVMDSTTAMNEQRAERPETGNYYLPHRQFQELDYVLDREVESLVCYDDDIATSLDGLNDVRNAAGG